MAYNVVDSYSNFVAKWPVLMLSLSTLISVGLGGGAYLLKRDVRPEFDKAAKGFENRGTDLAARIYTRSQAVEMAQCEQKLSALPNTTTFHTFAWFPSNNDPFPQCPYKGENGGGQGNLCKTSFDGTCDEGYNGVIDTSAPFNRMKCASGTDCTDCGRCSEQPVYAPSPPAYPPFRRLSEAPPPLEYCSSSVFTAWALQIVFEGDSSSADLLSATALRGTCELMGRLRSRFLSSSTCSWTGNSGGCCPDRSLGNIAALLGGKPSCADVNDADADALKAKLEVCAPAYHNGTLRRLDQWDPAINEPSGCGYGNYVYDALNALIDKEYLHPAHARVTPRYVKTMVPFSWDNTLLTRVHTDFLAAEVGRSFGGAKLIAYQAADIKGSLFQTVLVREDLPMIGIGIVLVFFTMYFYCGSLFFSFLAFLQIIFSLAFAYGVYVLLVQMPFFPFLNITGVYICIGIGADDIFVFVAAYDEVFRKRFTATGPPKIDGAFLAEVLRDAGLATLVTSITTAGAFFSSASSSVTSIRCFGLYCGIVVLCDWLLMISYVPALVVVYSRYVKDACGGSRVECCPHTPLKGNHPQQRMLKLSLGEACSGALVTPLTHPLSASLLVLLGLGLGLGFGSQYVSPGFVYPASSDLQLLRSSSPLEQYCCTGAKVKSEFIQDASDEGTDQYDVTLIFGQAMVDNGNSWDPESYPRSQLSPSFDMTTRAAQSFLLNLCAAARAAPWYSPLAYRQPGGEHRCSLERLLDAAETPCASAPADFAPHCCGLSRADFPFAPEQFGACLASMQWHAARQAYESARSGSSPAVPFGAERARAGYSVGELTGVWWEARASPPRAALLQLTFGSNVSYSQEYEVARRAYDEFAAWTERALASAPDELAGGYFSSGYQQQYFSLQTGLATSAQQSTFIAVGIAALVLLFMTRNAVIALYATLCIVLIMGAVSGIVILMGWEQGIIESIIVSCGIGMSCDFAAHLGFAYRQACRSNPSGSRKDFVGVAIDRMVPALAAAALSTGVMGALMYNAGTVFTQKFGIFVCLLMLFGLFLGVAFLLPLLALFGPTGSCGELAPSAHRKVHESQQSLNTKALHNLSGEYHTKSQKSLKSNALQYSAESHHNSL
ncbi:hypothetical protein AB1Y20_002357 [Prymnesium parvum]|uniref:SSD domain-containing protein n=1 Tax=Prymnesium parvum TaxID=97485 RepID=A0AB34J942_PRYPA